MTIRWFFLLPLFLFVASCGDDEPEVPEEAIVFNYDGQNLTAPTLPTGLYEFAARFPTSLTRLAEGRSITQVQFYLYDQPSQMYLNISVDDTSTIPGAILNTQLITNASPNSWNTITLNEPFLLDGSSVWVGIEVTHDQQQQSVGCDAGPADSNGDWLYDEETMTWETFSNRTSGAESVNWNIKAIVE